jgi:hypothetical protein
MLCTTPWGTGEQVRAACTQHTVCTGTADTSMERPDLAVRTKRKALEIVFS